MPLSDFTLCINQSIGISLGLHRLRHSAHPWCSLLPGKGEPPGTGCFPACGMRVRACHRCLDGNCKHLSWRSISGGSPSARAVPAGLSCLLLQLGHVWVLGHSWKCSAELRSHRMPSIKATLPSSTGNSSLCSSLDISAGRCRGCS